MKIFKIVDISVVNVLLTYVPLIISSGKEVYYIHISSCISGILLVL